jgi:hypothetical protein
MSGNPPCGKKNHEQDGVDGKSKSRGGYIEVRPNRIRSVDDWMPAQRRD